MKFWLVAALNFGTVLCSGEGLHYEGVWDNIRQGKSLESHQSYWIQFPDEKCTSCINSIGMAGIIYGRRLPNSALK